MRGWETQVGQSPDRTDKRKTNMLGDRTDKKTGRQIGYWQTNGGMLGDTGGKVLRQQMNAKWERIYSQNV